MSRYRPPADLPKSWAGNFRAIYPDRPEADFDASRKAVSPGDENGGYILDRFEWAEYPESDGTPVLLGYFDAVTVAVQRRAPLQEWP